MGSIRTPEDLYDKLAIDLAWRKKELYSIRTLTARSKDVKLETLIRSSIALTYAHFEGFTKNSVKFYFNFLNSQKLKVSDVKSNIVAVELKATFEKSLTAHSIKPLTELVDSLGNKNIICKNLLKYRPYTGANLNYERLINISYALGINTDSFTSLKHLIDENLLANRNSIAHGDYVIMDQDEINELQDRIILILTEIKDQLTNNAVLKNFLKK